MSAEALALVAIGGFFAAILRFLLTHNDVGFPWRTLAINIAGSFALGLILAGIEPTGIWRDLLVIGFCGTLTTFSSFAWQAVALAGGRRRLEALAYLGATTAFTVLGGWLGMALGHQL
jgi:CrcB protein